jgi:SAM-dependent methyltransferase
MNVRGLSDEEANSLSAGDEHYRAFVGAPDSYDLHGALQFQLLCALGLREHHRVLDFGCGSLRAGRLLIPYLAPGRYCGLEPNRWLIEDAISHQLGRDILAIKQPTFHQFDDFRAERSGTGFDFILAHSVLTHAGLDIFARVLDGFCAALATDGLAVFTIHPRLSPDAREAPATGWIYPGLCAYARDTVETLIAEAGLHGRRLGPYRPRADLPRQDWYAVSRAERRLEEMEAHLLQANAVFGSWRPERMAGSPTAPRQERISQHAFPAAAVNPKSVLLVTLDSCRYDTFKNAHTPNMKAVGELHAAQAPSHFTFASHAAMFVGVTPGIADVRAPYLNPKFAKIVRVHNEGRRPFGPAAFELDGPNIARGFARTGYRTLGSGALPWFDPARLHGEVLTDGFERFFYTASLFRFKDQVRWLDGEIEGAGQRPVFAFLNVGETHVPYWHEGAPWSPDDNPCLPFQAEDRSTDCAARQRSCVEYVDSVIAGILARFSGATVIITADHGDCWGEDGVWEHTIAHPAVLTVPLVFRVNAEVDAARLRKHAMEDKIRMTKGLTDYAGTRQDRTDNDEETEARSDVAVLTPDSVVMLRTDLVTTTMDGEILMIDSKGEMCHAAGATGSEIIALLDGSRNLRDVMGCLVAKYDVDPMTCEQDVMAFIAEIDRRGLVTKDR